MSETLLQFLEGCIAEERLQRFRDVLSHRTRHVALVLENVFHVHNASACLRTCDCFGVQDVHTIESHNSFEPNKGVALGASKWLTIRRYSRKLSDDKNDTAATADCIKHLRDHGYRILATSPRQNSKPLDEVTIDGKTAVIFGAEQMGVSDFAISQADDLIHIPMFGFTESFNISVSVAMVLQHLIGQLNANATDWKISEAEKRELFEKWVRISLGDKLPPLLRRFEESQAK